MSQASVKFSFYLDVSIFTGFIAYTAVSPSPVHHQSQTSTYKPAKFHQFRCLVGSEDVKSSRETDSCSRGSSEPGSGGTFSSGSMGCLCDAVTKQNPGMLTMHLLLECYKAAINH